MNYWSETTRLDFSSVLRKRHTKTTCGGAILTNCNNSRSIFWLQFLWENFYLEGFSNRGRGGFSKSRKIFSFFFFFFFFFFVFFMCSDSKWIGKIICSATIL